MNRWWERMNVPVVYGGVFSLLASLLIVACGDRRASDPESAATFAGIAGSYAGTLPCEICPGVDFTLTLRPDSIYFLRTRYLGNAGPQGPGMFDEIGRWSASVDSMAVLLNNGRGLTVPLAIRPDGSLSLRDTAGRPAAAGLDYVLRRATRAFEPRLLLRGMYSYMADAGIFEESQTGLRLPITAEEDNAALESAYLERRREPGEKIPVSFEGRIVTRPADGGGSREMIVVERFNGVQP